MDCSLRNENFYHGIFSHEYFQPLTFPKLRYMACFHNATVTLVWLLAAVVYQNGPYLRDPLHFKTYNVPMTWIG